MDGGMDGGINGGLDAGMDGIKNFGILEFGTGWSQKLDRMATEE